MKITKTTKDSTTTYFYDGVKKYQHFKNSDGYEWWSDDNPENPNFIKEEDIKPFEFGN